MTELRKPSFNYLDVDVSNEAFCVAPTVWQCLLAVSARKNPLWYVYEIYVDDPIPVEELNKNVADADLVNEHRITVDVLNRNGSSIETKLIGNLRITIDETTLIKMAAIHHGVRPNANQERDVLWNVSDLGDWTLRECGSRIEESWKSITGKNQ
jgi:hypothetical protein